MLVECGFTRATTPDGVEFTFTPSFARIATLGDPQFIVRLYAGLFGPRAVQEARYVLACLCDQEDPMPLIGWTDDDGTHPGGMSDVEQVLIAQHLMRHGIAGNAKPETAGAASGKFSDRFDAAEYVSAARVHMGLSSADAEALSMTEFQTMLAMKYPDKNKARDVPSRAEYDAGMARLKEKSNG